MIYIYMIYIYMIYIYMIYIYIYDIYIIYIYPGLFFQYDKKNDGYDLGISGYDWSIWVSPI